MAKRKLVKARADARGGLNTAVSQDLLNPNEFIELTNARLDASLGAVTKRGGSKRLHAAAIVADTDVDGVTVWDGPSGKQVVAITNGKLYYYNIGATEFGVTWSGPVADGSQDFQTTNRVQFAQMRSTGASGALVLYISDGTHTFSWNGTDTVTQLDGTDGVPASAVLEPYHTRMFYAGVPTFKNHVYWSKIGDPTYVTAGAASDGGAAMVNVTRGEEIVALAAARAGLVIATEDTLARFTGYSDDDIQLGQDTEGLSSTVGCVGKDAIISVESAVVLLTDIGPYIVGDGRPTPLGSKVEPEFDALERDRLNETSVAFHKGRREIWFAVPATGDDDLQTIYCYSLRLNSWAGPWEYPFDIIQLASYENDDGDEGIIAACADGFVRKMDEGWKDDVLSDGTSGSTYTMTVQLAPEFFETGPGFEKLLYRVMAQLYAPSGTSPVLTAIFDSDSSPDSRTVTGAATNIQNYRVDFPNPQGSRLVMKLTDGGATDKVALHGLVMYAYDLQRMI